MATVEFAEGGTSTVGLGTGMQHASIPDEKKILLTPVPQLNDDHSESHDAIKFKPIVLNDDEHSVRYAMANIMTGGESPFAMANFELAGFGKFDKLESEMAAKEKVTEEGQDDFTETTGDAEIDILCNVPPQVSYVNRFSFINIISSFCDLQGFEEKENYSEMTRLEEELKISAKMATCGVIMGANYTALASFEKTDGVLGEAAWMASTLSVLVTLFVIVAPLGMPRFLIALAAIFTGLSYMAFVAMKFA